MNVLKTLVTHTHVNVGLVPVVAHATPASNPYVFVEALSQMFRRLKLNAENPCRQREAGMEGLGLLVDTPQKMAHSKPGT